MQTEGSGIVTHQFHQGNNMYKPSRRRTKSTGAIIEYIENLIKKQSRKTKEKLVTNPEELKTLALDIEGASLIFVD